MKFVLIKLKEPLVTTYLFSPSFLDRQRISFFQLVLICLRSVIISRNHLPQTLGIYEDDNEIYPVIWCDNYDSEVEHSVKIYFELDNHSRDNKKIFKKINKKV